MAGALPLRMAASPSRELNDVQKHWCMRWKKIVFTMAHARKKKQLSSPEVS